MKKENDLFMHTEIICSTKTQNSGVVIRSNDTVAVRPCSALSNTSISLPERRTCALSITVRARATVPRGESFARGGVRLGES